MDIDAAISTVSTLDAFHVSAEVKRYWQQPKTGLFRETIVSAQVSVLLHTETWFKRALLAPDLRGDIHLDSARRLVRRLEVLGGDRMFVRDWYLLVASFLHAGREIGLSRSHLAEARRQFPGDALILVASGSDHELLSAAPTGWVQFFGLDGKPTVQDQVNVDDELERAAGFFQAALTAHADKQGSDEARLRLGRVLCRRGALESAARELSAVHTAAATPPLKYLSAVFLAMLEVDRQHFERAHELYNEAVRMYPLGQTAVIGLSELAYRRGRPSEAASVITWLLEQTRKDDPWWSYLLGEAWHFEARLDALRARVRA